MYKFLKKIRYTYLLWLMACLCVMLSCNKPTETIQSDWVLTQMQRDSLSFEKYHHYNIGTNFILKSDSLCLLAHPVGWPNTFDSVTDSTIIKYGDDFVVTEIFRPEVYNELSTDSVWLRVASDGVHLGWIDETTMLKKSTPISPISQFIYTFSGNHLYIFLIILAVMCVFVCYCHFKHKLLWFVHFRDATSLYPCAFTLTMASASMIYSTIQKFYPEIWETYYFSPSLNPFSQPILISLFLITIWLSVLFLLSVAFDMIEKVSFFSTFSYVLSMVCLGCVVYLILTFTIPLYFGYVLYLVYVYYSIDKFVKLQSVTLEHKKVL